jgi:DNA-binding CsgD family transcriptional regulator
VEAGRLIAGAGAPDDPFLTVMAATGALVGGVVESSDALIGPALELSRWEEWRRERPEQWLPMFTVSAGVETLLMVGQHEVVRDLVESTLARVDPADLLVWMVGGFYLGVAEYHGGRWAQARARLSEAVRLGAEIERPRHVRFARSQLAQLAGAQGDEPGARTHAAAAISAAPTAGPAGIAAGAGLGLLALGRGDYEQAAVRYERDVLDGAGPFLLRHDVADAIESYVRAGRVADATTWLVRFDDQAGRAGWPWALARAGHLRGLLGEEDAFNDALRHHDRAREPFPRARTELALGERLRRAGQRRAAREPLRAALAAFGALEAAPWEQRAAAELRATGERVRRRDDPDTSRLTAQELQVALVVARGATNKEAAAQLFLSPKTVEKHLGAAYSKLGLRSRAELARLVAEQESAPVLG